jgi:hypothetical protein
MTQNDLEDLTARYLLFTGKVKHGHFLRYLLQTQERMRLLETHDIQRQVKSSALTGDPDLVFEVYHVEEPEWLHLDPDPSLALVKMMEGTDATLYQAIQAAIDEEKLPAREVLDPDSPEIPHLQTLRELSYLHERNQIPPQGLATRPYLLNNISVLKTGPDEALLENNLSLFNRCMSRLIPTFERHGFTLVAAGQFDAHPDLILNIWEFHDIEEHTELMLTLADNLTYSTLDEICNQDQHICRNVSRFHQRHPFLMPRQTAAGVTP